MEAKHLIEQRNRFNQRLTLDIELANGEPLNLNQYLKRMLETQSLEAWNGNQEQLRDWLASQVSQYIKQSDVKIYGWSN